MWVHIVDIRPHVVVRRWRAWGVLGRRSFCREALKVVDSTQPRVVVDNSLVAWPPNHKYVTYSLSDCATVSDMCDLDLALTTNAVITMVTSDEPEDVQGSANGKNRGDDGGDGNSLEDIVIIDEQTVMLRAERLGGGDGRVYSIHFEVVDSSGNTAEAACLVSVPHDLGAGSTAVDSGPRYQVTR